MHTASLLVPPHSTTSQTFSSPVWKRMLASSQEPRVHDISAYACLRVHIFWISRPDNWCKELQHTAVVHHPHRASQTRSDKFTCRAVTILHEWVQPCTTWHTCRQSKVLDNWLCPLKIDQHFPFVLFPGYSMFCGTCSWITDKFSPTHWNWTDFFKSYGFHLNYSI